LEGKPRRWRWYAFPAPEQRSRLNFVRCRI
jgi:hypothetical protein